MAVSGACWLLRRVATEPVWCGEHRWPSQLVAALRACMLLTDRDATARAAGSDADGLDVGTCLQTGTISLGALAFGVAGDQHSAVVVACPPACACKGHHARCIAVAVVLFRALAHRSAAVSAFVAAAQQQAAAAASDFTVRTTLVASTDTETASLPHQPLAVVLLRAWESCIRARMWLCQPPEARANVRVLVFSAVHRADLGDTALTAEWGCYVDCAMLTARASPPHVPQRLRAQLEQAAAACTLAARGADVPIPVLVDAGDCNVLLAVTYHAQDRLLVVAIGERRADASGCTCATVSAADASCPCRGLWSMSSAFKQPSDGAPADSPTSLQVDPPTPTFPLQTPFVTPAAAEGRMSAMKLNASAKQVGAVALSAPPANAETAERNPTTTSTGSEPDGALVTSRLASLSFAFSEQDGAETARGSPFLATFVSANSVRTLSDSTAADKSRPAPASGPQPDAPGRVSPGDLTQAPMHGEGPEPTVAAVPTRPAAIRPVNPRIRLHVRGAAAAPSSVPPIQALPVEQTSPPMSGSPGSTAETPLATTSIAGGTFFLSESSYLDARDS